MGALLGQNIASARRNRGWTQYELAEQVGIESVTVSRLETGASLPSIVRLADIADVLGVSLADLVGGVSPRSQDQAEEVMECLAQVSEDDRYFLVDIFKGLAARLARK